MTSIDPITNANSDRRDRRNGPNDKPASIAARPAPSNSAAALKLVTRSRGATIAELSAATGWQPHSVRAHLSGLRKKGIVLLREPRKTGEGAYRVANVDSCDTSAAPRNDGPAVYAARVADADNADLVADAAAGSWALSMKLWLRWRQCRRRSSAPNGDEFTEPRRLR